MSRCQNQDKILWLVLILTSVFGGVLMFIPSLLRSATAVWDLSKPEDFQFDASQIEFTGSGARLKAKDQIDDDSSAAGFGGGAQAGTTWDGAALTLSGNATLGYWKFDDAMWNGYPGQVRDSSGRGHHGTAAGGASVTTTGRYYKAGSFDGVNDYVRTNLPYTTTKDLTVSAWFKTNSIAERMTVVGGNNGGRFEVYVHQGRAGCRVWDTTERSIYTDETYLDDWHQAVCVQTYGSVGSTSLYVDGQLKKTTPYSSVSAGGVWQFGRPGSTLANYFFGLIDNVTIQSRALSDEEVNSQYLDAAPLHSGRFVSRVMSASSSVNWTGLAVAGLGAPYGKPLPGSGQIETGYAGDSVDMTGNTLLLHFDEVGWNGTVGEARDSSGFGNHGAAQKGLSNIDTGRFGRAASFDGSDDHLVIPDSDSLDLGDKMSISVWIRPRALTGFYPVILSKFSSIYDRYQLFLDSTAGYRVRFTANASSLVRANRAPTPGEWNHVAATYDGSQVNYYINGAPAGGGKLTMTQSGGDKAPLSIGARVNGDEVTANFTGDIDELAIFNRILSPTEVAAHYRRGALNLKFQARSCPDESCVGVEFTGPDGTAGSFYSELTNGAAAPASSFVLSAVPANPFFQYVGYLSALTTVYPKFTSIAATPAHYPSSGVVEPHPDKSVNYLSFLQSFNTEESPPGAVLYQLTNQGDMSQPAWYYWDGSVWTPTGSLAQAATSTIVKEHLDKFASQFGSGQFSWRAIFSPQVGAEATVLAQVKLAYNTPPGEPTVLAVSDSQAAVEAATPGATLATATPFFSAQYNDADAEDSAVKVRIQVTTDPTFATVTHWDSGYLGANITTTTAGTRLPGVAYGGLGGPPILPLALNDGPVTYYWRLQAFDVAGAAGVFSAASSFNLLDIPAAPASVAATRILDDHFTVAWQDSSGAEDGFVVERNTDLGSGFLGFVPLATTTSNVGSYADMTTKADARYMYRVIAFNSLGRSAPAADPVTHFTTPDTPAAVAARATNPNDFSVSFVDLAKVVDTHALERCGGAGCETAYQPLAGSPFAGSPQTDAGLAPDSRYRWRANAVTPENVNSDYAYSAYEFTSPAAPQNAQASLISDNELRVTWEEKSSYESGFIVYSASPTGGFTPLSDSLPTVGAGETSYITATVKPNSAYRFLARSYIGATSANSALLSEPSAETTIIYTTPAAPAALKAVPQSDSAISWQFTDAANYEAGFKLLSATGTLLKTVETANISAITESSLAPNAKYERVVKAFQGAQDSSSSTLMSAYTLARMPASAALSVLEQNLIKITWEDAGNPEGTEFEVKNLTTGASSGWQTGRVFFVSGLTCGTSYTLVVRARNGDKIETAASEPVSAVTEDCTGGGGTTGGGGGGGSGTPSGEDIGGEGGGPIEDNEAGFLKDKLVKGQIPANFATSTALLPPPIIISPVEHSTIKTLPFIIVGQSKPGAEVVVRIAGTEYQVAANEKGQWQVWVLDQLVNGPYQIMVWQKNGSSQLGQPASRQILVLRADEPAVTAVTPSSPAEPERESGLPAESIPEKTVESLSEVNKPNIAKSPTVAKVAEIRRQVEKQSSFLLIVSQETARFYRHQVGTVEVTNKEGLEVYLRPPFPVRSVTARLLDEKGKPSAGSLLAKRPNSDVYHGIVSLFKLPLGKYKLAITLNGTDGTRTEMSKAVKIVASGKVVSSDAAVSRAAITVFAQDTDGEYRPWPAELYGARNPVYSEADGGYALALPPGQYYLRVDAPRHYSAASRPLVVKEPELVTGDLALTLRPLTLWDKLWRWFGKVRE